MSESKAAPKLLTARSAQEWFTTTDAVTYTRVSLSTIKRAIADGSLQPDSPSRPGFRLHRFRRGTLDAWLTGEAANGTAQER